MNYPTDAELSTDSRIAAALERIADALERPIPLPIYQRRFTAEQIDHLADQLKELAPHVLPIFIKTQAEYTQANGQPIQRTDAPTDNPELMGLLK